jgi:hypothetical protein
LIEALGLIHDLGKMSDRLLKNHDPSSTVKYGYNLLSDPSSIDTYVNYQNIASDAGAEFVTEILHTSQNIPCAFNEKPDINNLLKEIEFTWIGEQYNFAELMPILTKTKLSVDQNANWNRVLGKSMKPGLLIGYLHGIAHIDKEGDPEDHKQPYSSVFRATPFGDEEQVGTEVIKELTITLNELPLDNIEKITTPQRSEWLNQMMVLMKRGLADNRRPHNEISLWDWGYSVATLAKAATNYIFKNGWITNIRELPFCTLRINLDILERYAHSDQISDLLGVKQALEHAFNKVQILLEETYAFGNKLYGDETGDYYLMPDIFSTNEQITLRQEIQVLFPPDLYPQVYFSNPITANHIHDVDNSKSTNPNKLIAESRTNALAEKPVNSNNLYLFETEWKDGRPKNSEACTACGMRPVGYPRQNLYPEIEITLSVWAKEQKAKDRKICRVCLDRRGRRSKQWVNEDLNDLNHTIWTDEVADDHGRLALFVGKLGLEGWLDGTLLSTIQVTDKVTKNPSPARLYRIAETTRAFWQKVKDELIPNMVSQSIFRLELYPDSNDCSDLGDYHAYDLDVDGIVLSVVWDKPNKRFLTTDNLNYFAQNLLDTLDDLVGNLKRKLEGNVFKIFEPSSFLKSRHIRTKITIKKIEPTGDYLPVISLLTEASLCFILIPADKALKLAHQVKKEYEQQMGRVRDRLPLDIGLIFCNRRTPIRAVLEAGRSMLNLSTQFNMDSGKGWEGWRLMKKECSGGFVKLQFDNGITWDIPVVTGDGSKKDEWYPQLYQGNSWKKGNQPKPKHICDLDLKASTNPRIPTKVWVRPSHFDFEYLDSTARRFEIHYDEETGRRPRPTRPFYLEDLDRFDILWKILKKLQFSQRHQVIYTIEATRKMWYGKEPQKSWTDSVFKQFVTDTLANAAWPKDKQWKDIAEHQQLIDAGVWGELADLANLHMEILKER